jgi:hypothetical protein
MRLSALRPPGKVRIDGVVSRLTASLVRQAVGEREVSSSQIRSECGTVIFLSGFPTAF